MRDDDDWRFPPQKPTPDSLPRLTVRLLLPMFCSSTSCWCTVSSWGQALRRCSVCLSPDLRIEISAPPRHQRSASALHVVCVRREWRAGGRPQKSAEMPRYPTRRTLFFKAQKIGRFALSRTWLRMCQRTKAGVARRRLEAGVAEVAASLIEREF